MIDPPSDQFIYLTEWASCPPDARWTERDMLLDRSRITMPLLTSHVIDVAAALEARAMVWPCDFCAYPGAKRSGILNFRSRLRIPAATGAIAAGGCAPYRHSGLLSPPRVSEATDAPLR